MDLEWAIKNEELFLLQARPITTLNKQNKTSNIKYDLIGMEWSRLMLIERYPDALTPFTAAATTEVFFESFSEVNKIIGTSMPKDIPMVKIMYGRPYINVSLMNSGNINTEVKSKKKSEKLKHKKQNIVSLYKFFKLLLTNKNNWIALQNPFERLMRKKTQINFSTLCVQELLKENDNITSEIVKLLAVHSKSLVASEVSL